MELLETIAVEVMGAEPEDAHALQVLRERFADLDANLLASGVDPRALDLTSRALGELDALLQGQAQDRAATLATVVRATGSLQKLLARLGESGARESSDGPPAEPSAEPRTAAPAEVPPAPAPTATRPPPPPPAACVRRDSEMLTLLAEFLAESEDGLSCVDDALLCVERSGPDAEKLNAVFRVFHTIKGVAGFLDLAHVVKLAHHSEALLNRCRDGALVLQGGPLELAFESTAAMRRALSDVRQAVEEGVAFGEPPELSLLLGQLEAATHGTLSPAAATARVASATAPAISPQASTTAPAAEAPAPPPTPSVPPPAPPAPAPALATPAPAAAPAPAPASTAASEAPAESRSESESAPVKLKETLKVDVERVDSLVELIGELVVVESMVVHAPELEKLVSSRLRRSLSQLAKVTRDLQDVGMRMRMVPVRALFHRMERLTRDLAHKSGKQVTFVASGEASEMDRSMVEQLGDPLVHMIRNAVDHGIEPVDERLAAGKPAVATLRLSAYHEGGSIVIELGEDGRGLDRKAILKKARAKGLVPEGVTPSDAEIDALIFAPGFSTAAQVTELSGRGVGMDVVKRNVDALRGRVVISSTPGEGTTFRIVLPLTLAIIDGMLIACGGEDYIIPTLSIVESLRPDPSMVLTLGGVREMVNVRGEILPLMRLERLLDIGETSKPATDRIVVIVEGVGRKFGLLVDEVITQQQVVIKSLDGSLADVRHLSGAAILANGRVGLILNVEELGVQAHQARESMPTAPGDRDPSAPPPPSATIAPSAAAARAVATHAAAA